MTLARKVEKIDVESLVDLKKFQISTAQTALAQEQAQGFPTKGYLTLVDNKETQDLSRLKLFGKISYFAPQQLLKIAIDALDLLIANSPRGRGSAADRTGRYWENHIVLFNKQVLSDEGSLRRALSAPGVRDARNDEIILVNIQPYARKIERGHSPQTPKGVYKRVTAILRRKYSKIAFISQRYIKASSVPGLSSAVVTKRKGTKGGMSRQVANVYPAIRIKRGRGTNG